MNEEDLNYVMRQLEGDAKNDEMVRNLARNTGIFYNKLSDDGLPAAEITNFTLGFLAQMMILNKKEFEM